MNEAQDIIDQIPLKLTPFPYQADGIRYNLRHKKVIIGDEPGLGKTLQSIASVIGSGLLDKGPCLVICPNSLKVNWKKEWSKCSSEKAVILVDEIKHSWQHYYHAGMARVFIVNYESLKKYFVLKMPDKDRYKARDIEFNPVINLFSSIIIDESHKVKNTRAQVSKITLGIAWKKDMVLAITGTPMKNKPEDLVAQLAIIGQIQHFGGISGFKHYFCSGPKKRSNLSQLNYLLNKHCFYRRLKKDVLDQLPDKMRTRVYCELPESYAVEYRSAMLDLEKYLKNYKNASDSKIRNAMRGEIMVRIGILKNISARGKFRDVCEYIDDIMSAGEKLILFVSLREIGDAFKSKYPGAVMIRGGVSTEDRNQAVERFQSDPRVKLIICSIQAAGVGLTLTASSRVAFVELPWTAADTDQCEDRAHRIGQKDSVQCIYFLGRGTIDNHIYNVIQEKRVTAMEIVGDENDVVENEVDSLINLISK